MALHTWPKFYFNFKITEDNLSLAFDEGGGELIAQVPHGSYAPTPGLTQVASAMSDAGSQTYGVTLDRSTRLVTISATNPFDLLVATGSPANFIWTLLGFTGADRTGTNIYTGNLPTMSQYLPQFKLQSYLSADHNKKSIDPTVKKTADGKVEVVRFGVETFVEMNLKMITNRPMDGRVIRNNPNGVSDAVAFMDFLITKIPVEFMPDEDLPTTFLTLILEKSGDDPNGMAYSLDELIDKNLPDFFDTGKLTMRVIE